MMAQALIYIVASLPSLGVVALALREGSNGNGWEIQATQGEREVTTKPLMLDDLARAGREAYGVHEKIDLCPWSESALKEEWLVIARAILTTIKEAGWKIVPVEASEEMIEACMAHWGSSAKTSPVTAQKRAEQYAAMIEAAPKIEGE